MKKRVCGSICLWYFIVIALCACGKQGSADRTEQEPSVVRTCDVSCSEEERAAEDDVVILVRHYEMSDGTWKTDTHTYQYRLEVTGRLSGAVRDSTYVYLSNIKNITFDQAWKASGLSSNRNDYFEEEEAILVGIR